MENVFLTHGWEYGLECVRSLGSHDVSEFSCFCCHPPLPDQPRPTHPPFMCFLGCFRILSRALVLGILVSSLSFMSTFLLALSLCCNTSE